MIRWLARAILTLAMLGSLALTGLAGARIANDPMLAPLRDRLAAGIAAETDRLMARAATPARMADLIAARLAEDPRNWVVLTALQDEVTARSITLAPDVAGALTAAWDEDTGLVAMAGDCAACLWDIAQCSLSNALICKAPILLTPIEDVRGIAKAGWDYTSGSPVDQVDLGLSILGLGATALVLASGGSSATVKAGAGLAKLARGMDILSPRLTAMVADAVRGGVDWGGLARVSSTADLGRVVRAGAFAPVTSVAADLGRIAGRLQPEQTLHLLRFVDDPADARRLANAAEAVGPRVVAQAEVLGKARLMRATLRWSEAAWHLLAGMVGLLAGLAMAVGSLAQTLSLRLLRRLAF